jgi:Domain of unknown function (DUF4350)
MPIAVTPGDKKLFLIAGGVLLVLVVIAAAFTPTGATEADYPTTYATGSNGAKAIYLLLKESGYHVERWEEPPGDLKATQNTTLILAEPKYIPTAEERRQFRSFIAGGARVIASGQFSGFLLPVSRGVPDPLTPDLPLTFKSRIPSAYSRVAPEITMSPSATWDDRLSATPLYGNEKNTVVVEYKYGKGEVIWLASATPLTNAGIRESGNLPFILTAVGDKSNTRVLFDEYFHGHRRSLVAAMAHTQVRWLVLQFALIALFSILAFSRRSGPIRALAPESRLSPLEFVDTLGGLYQNAHASMVAVDVYYQRFRYWLTRRAGIAANAGIPEMEQVVRDRWHFQDDDFAATLHACEEAKYNYQLAPKEALRLVQTLQRYAAIMKLFPRPKEKA